MKTSLAKTDPDGTPADSEDSFPAEAFAQLARLEEDHFWFRSRNRLIIWALQRYFPEAHTLLEVGCGTGVVLKAIHRAAPQIQLTGVDLSPEALGIAKTRVPADLIRMSAAELTFGHDFDVVCAFDVLEHVDDDRAVLRKLAEATRPGGGLLVTVPQHPSLWSAVDEYGRHRRRYAIGELDAKIREAGFTIQRSTSWVCALLPVVAISRLWDRVRESRFDPQRELKLPKLVNRAFELVLDGERAAIERGLTLPVGTSRLVVARR